MCFGIAIDFSFVTENVMTKQIQLDRVKFWIDNGVLFCKVQNSNNGQVIKKDNINDYVKAIAALSCGEYYPLLIDFRDVDNKDTIAQVRLLANNTELKSVILSKSFVVNSAFMQFMLVVLHGIYDPIIPNKVFKSFESAFQYSVEINQIFNAHS